MTTATADPAAAFEAALAADAGQQAPSDVPAPPRIDRDPEAPFGRDEGGGLIAPHGLRADGKPRLNPAGPGRGKTGAVDKPRVTSGPVAPPGTTVAVSGKPDYTDDLMTLGSTVWVGMSALKGGRLLGVRVPDCRPYAALWNAQLPQQAAAWNAAAQQNPTVRGYVTKFTGEGSMTWLIGVAVAGAGFLAGCVEIAKADPDKKAAIAAVNDAKMQQFIADQTGVEVEAAA